VRVSIGIGDHCAINGCEMYSFGVSTLASKQCHLPSHWVAPPKSDNFGKPAVGSHSGRTALTTTPAPFFETLCCDHCGSLNVCPIHHLRCALMCKWCAVR
jgi:hypothetical protein